MSNILEIAAALFGPTTGPNGRRSMSGETRQTAVVFDALSEGEIDGLVDGAASVYMDGTSLVDTDVYKGISAIKTTASISAASTTATVAVGALDFADTTEGTRTILIKGAGKQGSSLFSGTAGGTTLTASSSWFTEGMASTGIMSEGASRLEIAGGGLNGKPYIGFISKYTSATSVEVSPPFTTTISGATGGIDLVSQIASYNAGSNQVTTTTAATTTVSGVAATLSPPFVNATTYASTSPKTNFESINYAFRAGTEDQTPVQMLSTGSPTASYIHSPNTRLQQNNTYDGSNGVNDTVIESSAVGVPNPSETDQVKWVIECPQLFAISTKSGTEYNSWVEFTCDFQFSRDNGTSYTTVRLTGQTDTEILNRTGGYEYFNDQTSLSLHDGFIVNQTKKAFQEQYTHNIEQYKPFDTWRLVFKRVNEPNKPQSHHDNMNEAFLKYVEAQLTDRFTYPHTAYAALKYSAKDFSGTPKRTYHIRGKKIQVPTNYLTREEMAGNSPSYNRHITNGANQSGYQDWDGNFRGDVSEFAVSHKNHEKTYCNNPAWVFYDIITDPRYGLGDMIDADLVDKYALYQIARYCDELVDDGKGGFEPRFTCNAYISKATEAYKVLKDLASVFRGIGYWMDGQLVVVQDRPKEPIYTFSQGNVTDGEFVYESTSERIRANQIVVKWNDPADQYKAKSHIVDDVDNIIDKGRITSTSINAFGCTSEGQAHRIGQWRLITDKVETELCSFSTSINAGFVRPGDIINVQDHYLDAVQFSGRIKAGTSTTVVTLDRAVTLAANTTYELHLVYPTGGAYLEQDAATINSVVYARGDLVLLDEDGAAVNTEAKAANVQDDSNNEVMLAWSEHSRVEKQTITTSAGTIAAGANITVGTAFSSAPDSEVMWALTGKKNDEEVTGSAKQYRVMGIDEESEGVYSIAAAFYNDKKYDLVEKDYKVVSVPTSQLKALSTTGITAIDTFIPKPETITFSIQQVAGSDSAADNEESLAGNLQASIEWDAPIETTISSKVIANSYVNEALDASETTITLGAAATTSTGYGIIEKGTSNEEIIEWTAKSGNDITAVRGSLRSGAKEHVTGVSFTEIQSYETPYADLSNFEVEHTFHEGTRIEKFKRETVNGGETKLLVPNALGGTHNVRVRSISNGGQSSQWTTFENTVKAPGTVKATSKGNLAVGGTMSSPIEVTTAGAYNISNSLYSFTSASGQEYNISQASASHAQRTQSFSGLSASNGVGYSVFDTSASASDPWRALDQKTDTTFHTGGEGTAGSFTWWKDIGASNIGLTLATGTITVSANSSTITGSSTTFTSDFATGDMIRLGSTNDYAENTAAWYGYVDKVVSNTSLIVKGVVTKAFSSKFAYKQSFKPDFANDTIVSKITRTASSAYTVEHYGSVPGNDGADGAAGVGAYVVRLSASKYAIAYDIDGDESDTITFTAAPQGIVGTATYKFEVDGVQKQAASTTATYQMADSDEPASGGAKVVKVTMFDDSVEKATDSVSIYGIQDGEDAITVILTNEAHALPTTSGGTVTYTNSGTDIKVFKGSTALAYHASNASTFSIGTPDDTNITVGAASTVSTYTRRYAVASSITAATATISFPISVRNALGTATTFTKIQTLNKTVDGATGSTGQGANFVFKRNATSPSITADGLNIPSGWADSPPSGTDLLWSSKGVVAAGGTAYVWGTVFQVEGAAVAELRCYSDVVANNGSSPTKPGSSTYNATTSVLTLNDSNWNLAPPSVSSSGDTVYSCTTLVTGASTATAIAIGSGWSTPTIHTRKTDGDDGISVKTETLFIKSSGTPSYSATAGTYADPDDGNGSWSTTLPALTSDGDKAWAITRSFNSDNSSTPNWTAPVNILTRTNGTNATALTITSTDTSVAGQTTINFSDGSNFVVDDGTNGNDGDGVDVIYITASSTPATPSASSGAPSGWAFEIPAEPSGNNRIYVSFGVRSNNTGNYTWTAARILSGADGDDGDPGAPGATGAGTKAIYRNATLANKPGTPTADGLNIPSSPQQWSATPSVPSGTELQWMSIGVVAAGGTAYTWGIVIPNIIDKESISDLGFDKAEIGLGNVPNSSHTSAGYNTDSTSTILGNVITASVNQQAFVWTELSNAGFSPSSTTFQFDITFKNASGTTVSVAKWIATRDTTNDHIDNSGITNNVSGSGTTSAVVGGDSTTMLVTFTNGGTSITVSASLQSFTGFTFKTE
jgi:predicted phage tail protein